MNKTSWKLSALVSTLLLSGTLTAYASDRERDSEIYSFYNEYYQDEKVDEREEEDEKEEDERDERDEKDEDEKDEDDSTNTNTEIVLPTAYNANAGRLLGSQCAQCHGTNGVSTNEWDSIAGEDDLLDEIYDDEPIMSAQAHGYTEYEIILIANWLKTLSTDD